MNTLFENAIQSIQLGLEDYKSNDPRRPLSAVRNFYSGLLLLAKEALVRAVPNEDARIILAANLKLVLNDKGEVEIEAKGKKTLDFETINERLSDFGIKIDRSLLTSLNAIRNDIEHAYSQATQQVVREAIAKAFPVVVLLFRHMKLAPENELGETWAELEAVKLLFEKELSECKATMAKFTWQPVDYLSGIPLLCPDCGSRLVAQTDPENDDFQSAKFGCRSCGEAYDAEKVFVHSLDVHFATDSYISVKDGGDPYVDDCPECGLGTYVMDGEYFGCVWCGLVLEDCARCNAGITPNNAYHGNYALCDYCGHLMDKHD